MPHYTTFDANPSTLPAQVISAPRSMEPVPPNPSTTSLPVASRPSSVSSIQPIDFGSTLMADGSVDFGHGSVIAHPVPPIPSNASSTLPFKAIITHKPTKPFPNSTDSDSNTSPPSMQPLGQKNGDNSGQEANPKMGSQESSGTGGLLFGDGGNGN